jgi:glycogen synthase
MEPPPAGAAGATSHGALPLDVPAPAWCVDAVFADGPPPSSSSAEGGGPPSPAAARYDNAGGFDYSIPVVGSTLAPPPLHIVHVAVEMAPIAKVGGLADVVTALGRASAGGGHRVEVVLPRYGFFSHSPLLRGMRAAHEFDHDGVHVWAATCEVEGLPVFFLEPANGLFANDGSVYTSPGADAGRFAWFCGAAAAFLASRPGARPDIVHAHDWSAAPIARILAHSGGWGGGGGAGHTASASAHAASPSSPPPPGPPPVVLTIHNADFGVPALGEAAHHAARVTTVSPSYAADLRSTPAFAPHAGKLAGILNGIDPAMWDPAADPALPVAYDADSAVAGKAAARAALRARLGLTGWDDKPLAAVISRLTAQKGIGLIEHAAHTVLARGGQFVLLGSAPDPRVAAHFAGLAGRLAGPDACFYFGFDEGLSRLCVLGGFPSPFFSSLLCVGRSRSLFPFLSLSSSVSHTHTHAHTRTNPHSHHTTPPTHPTHHFRSIYAAADFILVPSMFEPCGLTQLIALRYGAVPVVRSTGGLADSVYDVDTPAGRGRAAWEVLGSTDAEGDGPACTNGFAFDGTDGRAVDSALHRALDTFYGGDTGDRTGFRALQARIMRQDWSWCVFGRVGGQARACVHAGRVAVFFRPFSLFVCPFPLSTQHTHRARPALDYEKLYRHAARH